MTPEAVRKAASIMISARDSDIPFDRLPEAVRPGTEQEGYAIQDEVVRQRAAMGQDLAGWKVGCTNRVMQEMLGLDGPSGGAVLAPNVLASPARMTASALCNPVAECELAVRLARNVEPREGGHDRDSVADCVATCMVAIEVAELRPPRRDDMAVGELIADDFFHKAAVTGTECGDWRKLDLAAARATTAVSGERRGEDLGSAIMGHPFEALAWLADCLIARGAALLAGQIVLTGSIVKAVPVGRGDDVLCAIDGLGSVRLTLT